MQKVVGSNPISRFQGAPATRGLSSFGFGAARVAFDENRRLTAERQEGMRPG